MLNIFSVLVVSVKFKVLKNNLMDFLKKYYLSLYVNYCGYYKGYIISYLEYMYLRDIVCG